MGDRTGIAWCDATWNCILDHGETFRPSICRKCRLIVAWLRGLGVEGESVAPLRVTAAEAELVREMGDINVRSYEYAGEPPETQPPQWHSGRTLIALADRLTAYAAGRKGT